MARATGTPQKYQRGMSQHNSEFGGKRRLMSRVSAQTTPRAKLEDEVQCQRPWAADPTTSPGRVVSQKAVERLVVRGKVTHSDGGGEEAGEGARSAAVELDKLDKWTSGQAGQVDKLDKWTSWTSGQVDWAYQQR